MADSWAALEAEIRRKAEDAMHETEGKSYLDANRNMTAFYSEGSPDRYRRTGQLGNTARTTGVSGLEATIYLDSQYEYNTGSYTAAKVMSEAEVGGSGILGKGGFWKKTEEDIQENLDSAFGKRFK